MKHIAYILTSLLTLTMPSLAAAESDAPKNGKTSGVQMTGTPLSKQDLRALRRDPDAYLRRALQSLYQVAPDGGVTSDLIEFAKERDVARQRAEILRDVFKHDLDGDLALSSEEIRQQLTVVPLAEKARLAGLVAATD